MTMSAQMSEVTGPTALEKMCRPAVPPPRTAGRRFAEAYEGQVVTPVRMAPAPV